METENIKIKTLLIIIASVAIFEGAAVFVSHVLRIAPMSFLLIVRLLEIVTIILVVATIEGDLLSIGLDSSTIMRGIEKGLLWSAAFGFLTGLVFLILHFTGINPFALIYTQLPSEKKDLAMFLIVGSIISTVAEEFFFRGILYGFFRRWGILAALIFTTIIFMLAHYKTGTIPLAQIAGGIIFAASYEIEKNLMVPIIIHILGNTAIFVSSMIM
ncbi:MAG: CPBP family intramembrane metalloprotease [Deltaproteobacteria bacterium]|nr:CPBP family intramembrane metalloprotease [Deltaproteobacteria bacterium]